MDRESGNATWYKRQDINQQRLSEPAAQFADSQTEQGTVQSNAKGKVATANRAGTGPAAVK